MNIALVDKKIFGDIWESSFFRTELSPGKILVFFHMRNEFNFSPYNFTYEAKNTKYICTTLYHFVYDIINGDSLQNYELLFKLKNTKLHFLYEMRHWFRTYPVGKAYLKDVKRHITSITDIGVFEPKNAEDRLWHLQEALRKVKTARYFISGQFNGEKLDNPALSEVKEFTENEHFLMENIFYERIKLRDRLDSMLDKGRIWKYFCPLRHKDLENQMHDFLEGQNTVQTTRDIVFDALENQ